jgi:hypothetical protein
VKKIAKKEKRTEDRKKNKKIWKGRPIYRINKKAQKDEQWRKRFWSYKRLPTSPYTHPMKYKKEEQEMHTCFSGWRWTRQILLSLYSKKFDYSLGGYSHQECWSRTRWRWKMSTLRERLKIIDYVLEHIIDFLVKMINMRQKEFVKLLPSGGIFD